ncbi:MAG TPA: sulfotransferase domain-containing protein [Steroidobacteraceae bacterium]|nr:sulfotransferase domain-containing protein [Steroidobacteraceae bacterium]
MAHFRQFLSPARRLLARAAQSRISRPFLPGERHDDDLFVVEFPKSGVTWLTFLLANVNAQIAGDRRVVTFFNLNDFVPDVQSVSHVGAPRAALPGYRFFKSHAPYIPEYRKVFYLVRDPRHVMVSYWTFLNSLGWFQGTLEQLVADKTHGIRAWVEHVTGWLDGIHPSASFALIRYEDLLANPHGELERLYRLLGMPITDEVIATAVQRSSIERMRELEAQAAAGHPALKNFEFVRRQAPGTARAPVPDRVREMIEREAAAVMQRIGYPRLTATHASESPLNTP